MRDNTAAIHAAPEFSVIDNGKEKWGLLKFMNPGACHRFYKAHARTQNETVWTDSRASWIGLNEQSKESFHQSGVSDHCKTLVMAASGKLSDKPSRPGEFRPAVTGGFWDAPSVIAGLPLAARNRIRAKLPPKTIRVCLSMSAGVNAEDMAKITAKIAHAIWQYTIAGGAVTLDIAFAGKACASSKATGLIVQTRVNASDVAGLATVFSPVWFRAVAGPLMTAFSEEARDSIPIPRTCPLPGAIWIGGVLSDALKAGEQVLRELQLVA